MYSTARKLSVLCIILVAVNIVGTFLTALVLFDNRLMLSFTHQISIMMCMIPTTATSLFLSVALRNIVSDLEIEVSNHNSSVKKLAERVKELDTKVN